MKFDLAKKLRTLSRKGNNFILAVSLFDRQYNQMTDLLSEQSAGN